MHIAKVCLVAGRVQGVFYRASTQREARTRGLVGHAKNLSDGRVEVLVVGAPERVEELVKWLWRGPPASHVVSVEVVNVALDDLSPLPEQFLTA